MTDFFTESQDETPCFYETEIRLLTSGLPIKKQKIRGTLPHITPETWVNCNIYRQSSVKKPTSKNTPSNNVLFLTETDVLLQSENECHHPANYIIPVLYILTFII